MIWVRTYHKDESEMSLRILCEEMGISGVRYDVWGWLCDKDE